MFIAVNSNIMKEERSQTNFYFKELDKEEQYNPKVSRKITQINVIETKTQ